MAVAGVLTGISILGSLLSGGSSDAAAQAQAVKNGDISIQLDPENKQIIFSIEEDDTVKPIIFDLLNGTIINATIRATTAATYLRNIKEYFCQLFLSEANFSRIFFNFLWGIFPAVFLQCFICFVNCLMMITNGSNPIFDLGVNLVNGSKIFRILIICFTPISRHSY
jgi:hypothetical protein